MTILALEELTREINSREAEFIRDSLQHALVMGGLLVRAKVETKKQKISWRDYLINSVPNISARTARLYMQIYLNSDYLSKKMATVATFTLKDAQQALNDRGSAQKKLSVQLQMEVEAAEVSNQSQIDLFANLLASMERTHADLLAVFGANDWEEFDREVLSDLLETIVAFEGTVNQSRTKLSRHLQSPSADCPNCDRPLISGMESCLNCFWNTGILPSA